MSVEARQIGALVRNLNVSEEKARALIAAGLPTTAKVIDAGEAVWAAHGLESAVAARLARRPQAE